MNATIGEVLKDVGKRVVDLEADSVHLSTPEDIESAVINRLSRLVDRLGVSLGFVRSDPSRAAKIVREIAAESVWAVRAIEAIE